MSTNSLYPGTTNGVCVTSIIKDKIREYMMSDSSQQVIKTPVEISICEIEKDKIDSVIHENKSINKQDPVSTTDLVLPSSLAVSMHNSTEPCPHKQDIVTSVRRIGNSLDALLQESKKASRTRPIKKSTLATQQNADRLFISSDQIRSRKSVSLHDICEEYIQFITVNSSVSGDEEAISTTSENETVMGVKNEEIELEIIPVSAAAIRNSQISVITINENSPRKPMNSVIIQSVEEMHVAVENECEKSNGESESNVVVDKSATANEVVEKDAAADTEIFANLNGVKTPADTIPATPEDQPQNIASVIKEQDKENIDQSKEQDVAGDDIKIKIDTAEEKPVVSNGVGYNVNDDIEEEDVIDEDDVVDEPSPSLPATDAKEQPTPPPSVPEQLPEPEPEAESKESPSEAKDSPPETVITNQKEPPVVEAESPAPVSDTVEKMETDVEEVVDQKSPVIEDEKPIEDDKMETDEVKSTASTEIVPKLEEELPSPPAAAEKVQEPDTEPKDSPPEEKPADSIVVADKPSPVAEISETVDEMDTADVEPVIKPVEDLSTKPIVDDEPEAVPVIEIKSVISLVKEKEPETKTKPIEDPVPEAKIEKKPVEPEKELATKETASVKRKAADTGEEPEQDRDGGISSSSSQSSSSEADNTQDCKRIRFDESIFEEDERERLIREFVERSTETSDEIGKNCDKLQHEIAALSDLARAKELEWNSIMRLLKLKEEMLERILFKKRHLDCQSKPELDANLNKMYKNFVTSSTTSTDQKSNRSETCTPTSINNHVTVVPISSSLASATSAASASTSSGGANANSGVPNAAATSQDLYSSLAGGKSSAAINSTLMSDSIGGKLRPQHRPILPKPPISSVTQSAAQSSHLSHALHAVQQAAAAQQQQAMIQPPHSSSQQQQQQQQMQQQAQSNMMQSNAAAAAALALVDQNSIIGEGRQGPILDVKSIIADFRSKNPDSLPRRGRRNLPFGGRGISDTGGPGPRFMGNTSLLSMANIALGSGSQIRTSVTSTTHNDHRPNSFMFGQDNSVPTSLTRTEMQMRHPTIDSLMLSVNQAAAAAAASGNSSQPNSSTNSSGSNNSNNDYFRETLVKIAKMSEKRGDMSNALHMGGNNKGGGSHLPPPPPYPEVTLHPVLVPQSSGSPPVQNSLLHGILTKSNAAAAAAAAQAASNQHHPSSTVGNAGPMGATSVSTIQHRPTTFSPTLARLLTAPERSRGHRTNIGSSGRSTKSTLNEILNSKKTRTEVTITPVTTSTACATKNGSDVVLDDDDESEATDRLVIDEGREVVAESASNVIPADQVPECQGCHKKAAQFVCAGCGNQWYCSRECQVEAWENHSEMCSG